MNIVLDSIIFELQRAGGVSVYWFELLSRMKTKFNKVAIFGRKNSNIFCLDLHLKNLQHESYPNFLPRRYMPFHAFNKKILEKKHIFHSSYFRYSNNPNSINVTTVHDFTYEYFVGGPRLWVHAWQKRLAVKKSKGIICVSENTRKDLLSFYPWVDPALVKVVYNGVSDVFAPVNDAREKLKNLLNFKCEKPFMLFVGDRSAYKKFDVFLALSDFFPEMDLILVGGQPFSDNELKKSNALGQRLQHFRGVSSEVLNLFYNSAHCFIYPSSYEGFGIPVLEAMKAGCPVVSTSLSSIPEVAGDAALLVDIPTAEKMAVEIKRIEDSQLRYQLIEKGFRQAAKFSWDKCFAETYSFYEELWERSDIK